MTTVVHIPSQEELCPAFIVPKLRGTAGKAIEKPSTATSLFIKERNKRYTTALLDDSVEYARMPTAPEDGASTEAPQVGELKGSKKRKKKKITKTQDKKSAVNSITDIPRLLRENGLILDISAIRSSFKTRLNTKIKNPMNTSPSYRATFQEMFWTILIMTPPTSPDSPGRLVTHDFIPYIRPTQIKTREPIVSERSYLKAIHLIDYIRHTGGLLHIFPVRSSLSELLGEISREINQNLFARYIGSRSFWPLRKRMSGLFVLLEWWGATHPMIISDYQTAISANAEDQDQCARLREELCKVVKVVPDRFAMQEEELARGFEFIARVRRKLTNVVREAYEALIIEAKARPDEFFENGLGAATAAEVWSEDVELKEAFDRMMGKDEAGRARTKGETNAYLIKRNRSLSPQRS